MECFLSIFVVLMLGIHCTHALYSFIYMGRAGFVAQRCAWQIQTTAPGSPTSLSSASHTRRIVSPGISTMKWCLGNHLSVMLEDNSGYPHNCFAVESLWGQPDAIQPVIPVTGSVSMLLSLHPEEYFNYYDLVMAHVLMHEAHSVGNPIREGIALVAGKTYDIFVNQRVTERLPAPYNTNCTDYLALWRKNGGYGPLTGKSCAEQCKMQSMVESTGCVAQTISYPNNYTVCTDPSIYPADNVIEQCSRQCSDACREVSYSLRSEIKFDKTEKCNGDANCEKKDLFLNFIFNRLEIEKFVHEPRYEGVEMFSYIGGYMGMWLGISLVALFDFAETLVALLTYACAKKRSSTRPI
ncbi:uncharacterized protein CDAR_418461 [Caerostris darwini]|uniref:Uncharacterized protein n=1 Tax=Caerostris darwini TaxID=1538125 RepID=A0AAV4MWX7_9ARAC|nr:uncharacterized protein CDAR_418461 [Caerostris darwini]